MSDEMVSEGSPADNNSVAYRLGWDTGYKEGLDESKPSIDAAYNDGFDAGHASGYIDGEADRDNASNRKAPPEFSEPFGEEE